MELKKIKKTEAAIFSLYIYCWFRAEKKKTQKFPPKHYSLTGILLTIVYANLKLKLLFQ